MFHHCIFYCAHFVYIYEMGRFWKVLGKLRALCCKITMADLSLFTTRLLFVAQKMASK